MEPMLTAVEAMSEQGCYTAQFRLSNGAEQSAILRVRDGVVGAPEANMIAGWSPESASFRAVIAVISAMDEARNLAGSQQPRLLDVDGGWDVGLGNVVLSPAGIPSCVAHGDLEPVGDERWRCPECGAGALFLQPG